MKQQLVVVGLLTTLAVIGCRALDGRRGYVSSVDDAAAPRVATAAVEADADHQDEVISLDALSPAIKQAAIDAVPGLVLSSAEREVENGLTLYSLKGAARGRQYEVEVSADGRVLEIEADDDDDDDDGEDDEDDD